MAPDNGWGPDMHTTGALDAQHTHRTALEGLNLGRDSANTVTCRSGSDNARDQPTTLTISGYSPLRFGRVSRGVFEARFRRGRLNRDAGVFRSLDLE